MIFGEADRLSKLEPSSECLNRKAVMDFKMPGVGQLITVLLVTGSGAMVSAITTVPLVELRNTSPLVSIITAAASTGSDNATITTVLTAQTVTDSLGNITENIKETADNVTNFAVNVTQVPENVTTADENVTPLSENVIPVKENVGTVTENATTVKGNVTPVPENVTHPSEDVTTVNENVTTVAENVTTVAENVTTVAENVTTVSVNVTDWRLGNPDNVTSKFSKTDSVGNKDKHVTLGAKWAACFEALNMSKPNSTTFTCDTFLLMHYSFKEFWTQQPAVKMCEHREAYGALMECVLEASKGCLPPENLVHVPDNSKARVGLNYICDVGLADEFDVNITCAQTHFRDVFECVHREVKMVTGRKSLPVPIWPRLMCRTYDIADLCCWERLQICGRQTAGAYTRMMSLYLRPPSCNGSASRFKSTNILTLLLIVLLCSFLITVSSTTYFYR